MRIRTTSLVGKGSRVASMRRPRLVVVNAVGVVSEDSRERWNNSKLLALETKSAKQGIGVRAI